MRDRTGGRGPSRDSRLALRTDDRAVSVTVGYVLTLAIGAVVLSGVVIGVSGVIDSQTDRTVRGDLAVVGQTTVANLESADRLARAAESDRDGYGEVTVSIDVDLPTRVAGIPYRIVIDENAVTLRTDNPDASVTVSHAADLDVTRTSVRGGPLRITYTDATGQLAVTER
ncbi:DUF7266 family protein [Halorubrum sp. DTA46]|uniref:DUF7266 family protein n=1 Tax=Halorubrum sp. DTA46 TaxID=3402162 RepID=UPI003AAEF501